MHAVKRIAALAVLSATAACGGGGAGTNADGTSSFTVAVIEPDITTVPILAAVDAVRQAGHKVEVVELAEPELAIEGLAKGDYAISAEATSPALIAIEQDAPIKIIADVIGNQWAIYGKPGIASCDDLSGRPFGIFSEGAVATAMAKEWVGAQCGAGKKPDYLTIGGSDVRAQALVAGEIDATPLEVSDVVALEGGTKFAQVVDFGKTLPDLHPQTVYANADFLTGHKAAAQAFVTALVREHAKINADPRHLVGLVAKYLPDEKPADVAEIAKRYVTAGLFDAGALTEQNVQGTIDFFARAGVIKPGMTARDAADLSFLKAAA
ncbi:NitT/TauT family transport system substrate-binding protein [Nonomuraea solani]|uniref:NitT/TauT family transport system substrate-binding protein n=1 Tax=Nonomuraea solani TaxID=1144553 RepID=A0A1H6ESX6_9ACTN|nr:ABC transporter substrate-binding protein [Nonomuraea solani]SEG99804.1 NitT/TauT family transport system substrate-binding protein [Nonomuraea solani]